MGIMLGNLSAKDIQNRLGIKLPDETIDFMESLRQHNATVTHGALEWHCFDIPFTMVCGNYFVAKEIYDKMTPHMSGCKGTMQISITEPPMSEQL